MKKRNLEIGVTPVDVKHNPSVRHMLHVSVWSDEDRVGDLLDQADFPFSRITGLRATVGDSVPLGGSHNDGPEDRLEVYLTGGSAVFHGYTDSQFWNDFSTALDYVG